MKISTVSLFFNYSSWCKIHYCYRYFVNILHSGQTVLCLQHCEQINYKQSPLWANSSQVLPISHCLQCGQGPDETLRWAGFRPPGHIFDAGSLNDTKLQRSEAAFVASSYLSWLKSVSAGGPSNVSPRHNSRQIILKVQAHLALTGGGRWHSEWFIRCYASKNTYRELSKLCNCNSACRFSAIWTGDTDSLSQCTLDCYNSTASVQLAVVCGDIIISCD